MPCEIRFRAGEVASATRHNRPTGRHTRLSKAAIQNKNVKSILPAPFSVNIIVPSTRKRKVPTPDDADGDLSSPPIRSMPSKRHKSLEVTPQAPAPAHRKKANPAVTRTRQQEHRIAVQPPQTCAPPNESPEPAGKPGEPASSLLPPALLELLGIHTALLRTLTVHVAHSRAAAAPLDIRDIVPSVSLGWGKRNVTIDDLRRCVAVQAMRSDASPFNIVDYGKGRMCIALAPGLDGRVDEEDLCAKFKENLAFFRDHLAEDQMSDVDIPMGGLSLADIPQAPIRSDAIPLASDPILAKGHRALAELKSSMAAKKEASAVAGQSPAPTATASSALGLLDRIRMKQLAKAEGPLPPSGPELARRAALQRIEDVAAMISMLSLQTPLGLPRQAYAMQGLVQRLKDSLRLPVSSDEAARCVRLLSEEVAPAWIRIMKIGGRENVIIQRAGQPIGRVVRERVRELLA